MFPTIMVALNLHLGRSLCVCGWIITVSNSRDVVHLWARRDRIRNENAERRRLLLFSNQIVRAIYS